MPIRSMSLGALLLLSAACAPSHTPVAPEILAVADPRAPESAFVAPADTLAGKPRTLELQVEDPRQHRMETTPKPSPTPEHRGHGSPTPKPTASATPKSESTIYTCPMHPEVRSDKPGSCPTCGMHLVPTKPTPTPKPSPSPTGHEHHGDHR